MMGRASDLLRETAIAVFAVGFSLLAGAALIAAEGHDPIEVYKVLFEESLGNPGGLAQVVFKATTLTFTGLSALFAFRAGLFNIGAEGQLYVGAFSAALAALAVPPGTSPILAMTAAIFAAAAGGALAATLPAVLKATRGTHEVINTMMMNFILISVVNWLLGFVRESPEVVRTRQVPDAARLSTFVRGFDGNSSALLAGGIAIACVYLFGHTRLGYELRVVGKNPRAAEFGGISVKRVSILALLVSGAIAGLGGVNFVLGSPGYFEQHFAPFQGFLGIAVALLGRNQPLAVIPAALLFAVMSEGSQSIQAFVPKELGNILQSIVVVFVILCTKAAEVIETRRAHAR